MAKDSERFQARILYIDQCLTAKEIASRLTLAEKTVGKWVEAGNWKELRLSKQCGPDVLITKYNDLLGSLLEKRLAFEKKQDKSDEDKSENAGVIDEMSKISAMIERTQKEGRVSLRAHIHALEKFMTSLRNHRPKLFTQELINYQIEYLDFLADELK